MARTLKALDLFCGAGGASKGLHNAGFQIFGIDIKPQPNYPFLFSRGDALRLGMSKDYDLVWASPPCQKFTAYKRRRNHVKEYPNLIPQIREEYIARQFLAGLK